jgi:hypothetical protein
MISRVWARTSTGLLTRMISAPITVLPEPVGATRRMRLRPAATSAWNAETTALW